MSFDLPANVRRELERYAQAEQVSPVEAASMLILSGIKAKRHKADLITDADIAAYYEDFPGFKALADVTEAEWEGVLKSARGMRKQGLSSRG